MKIKKIFLNFSMKCIAAMNCLVKTLDISLCYKDLCLQHKTNKLRKIKIISTNFHNFLKMQKVQLKKINISK